MTYDVFGGTLNLAVTLSNGEPPSLPRDQKWPRLTKCTHSQVVDLWLEGNVVNIIISTIDTPWTLVKMAAEWSMQWRTTAPECKGKSSHNAIILDAGSMLICGGGGGRHSSSSSSPAGSWQTCKQVWTQADSQTTRTGWPDPFPAVAKHNRQHSCCVWDQRGKESGEVGRCLPACLPGCLRADGSTARWKTT